ncbi:hypothetical protein GQX73_g7336 [Xylaria multiplex]|uniref:Uncharacterized protein n=1 Tax=Xylaria multiplex TaxID=323545 RepID=A0A7C8IXR2_9PEZI|nr:hypothetical protein GQX73_g7336 [Xylaria multiplex]
MLSTSMRYDRLCRLNGEIYTLEESTADLDQKRIEPNIDQLRQSSYRLNCGISAVAPRGVAVAQAAEPSKTTAAATTPLTKTSPSSRQTLPAPTIASGSDVRGAAIVASNTPPYSAQVLFPPKILGFGSSFSSSTSRTYSMNIPLKGGVSADVDMAAPPDQSQSNQTSAVAASSTNLTGQQGLDVMDVEPSQQAGDDTVNVAGSSGTQQDVEMKEETGQTTEAEVNTGENAEVYNDTATDTERPNKRRKVE